MTDTDARAAMKSPVLKRSIVIADHKTSVSLEEPFWQSVKEIALSRKLRVTDLIEEIDKGRGHANLSSATRLYVLAYYQNLQKAARLTRHVIEE